MIVKLIDRDLVRRYGPKAIKVDDSMGIVLVKHGKAMEVDKTGNKVEDKTKMIQGYLDKMIRYPNVDKSIKNEDDCIFPNLCISTT